MSLKQFTEKPAKGSKWISKRMQGLKKRKQKRRFRPRPYIDENELKKKNLKINKNQFPELS